ncbi:DUF4412 domain-containing protein [Bizionia arctica]|uniref:DUF4412 domain-containing protein n=1 Tax=Bizionia arctica TaxID=1495645 RepID=A0A917GG81_9FLAO|nr:DUF4412 domain-containing protein [Bizionia arctica]GGG44430.1 hypothetical protein GCM10010976_15020 [Bizionia arctica]
MKLLFTTILFVFSAFASQAQIFDRLADKAANSAERALDRKVEQKAQKETDKAFDSVFESDGTKKSKSSKEDTTTTNSKTPEAVYNFSHKYVMQIESGKNISTLTYFLAKNQNYFGNIIESTTIMMSVLDLTKKTMFMFTEAGGQKMLMSTSLDINDLVDDEDTTNKDIKVEKTNNTKVILNYTCREFIVTSDDFNGSFWVTQEADITFPSGFYNMDNKKSKTNQKWMNNVEGLMLEMDMTTTSGKKTESIKMTCVALEKSDFSINTKEYKKFM